MSGVKYLKYFKPPSISATFAPMFKRCTILLLITCILASNFNTLLVSTGFKLNQKYIAENLCENRDKPQLHCNGKCYFMKKIKQAQDKEKSDDAQTQKSMVQQAFCSAVNKVKFTSNLLQIFPERYRAMQPQKVSLSLLRPPQFAS